MLCFRFLALCFLATVGSATTTGPPVFGDLADRARSLPPEFAADALLRIAAAPNVTDVAWKRQVLEDAFQFAAGAQQPYARRHSSGKPGSMFDKAYEQGLDVCTLQCKAVHAMLAIDYKKARELFAIIAPPRPPHTSCDDALVYDVSIFYDMAAEVAARAFSAKEVANEEPFHLLQRYVSDLSSPTQVAPIARMIAHTTLKPAQFEALTDILAGALQQLSGDDRAFSATLSDGTEEAIADAHSPLLVDAWHAYVAKQLKDTRCSDPKPEGQCESVECQQLARQFTGLVIGPNGYGLTPEQKSTAEWGGKLRQYLAALADWKESGDPAEYFQFKTRFCSQLFSLAPGGPERDLILRTLLAWLQTNNYQRDHRAEWFFPVNALILQPSLQGELRRSPDPVIALYAQIEQLLPRPAAAGLDLL